MYYFRNIFIVNGLNKYVYKIVRRVSLPISVILNELKSELKGGLNSFYFSLENVLKRRLREGIDTEYKKLLKIRLYPAILSIALYEKGEINEKWSIIRWASLYAILKYYGELDYEIRDFLYKKLNLHEDLAEKAYETLKEILKGDLRKEQFIHLQCFEVGNKQNFIRHTGGFMDMRGASAMIDIATKTAGKVVSENLGREFLIVDEAGETIFLSSPKFAAKIEEKILEELSQDHLFLDVLIFRGNGARKINVAPNDLFNNFGEVYLLSLLSVRDLSISDAFTNDEKNKIKPSKLCRSCRRDKALDDKEVEKQIKKLVKRNVNEIRTSVCKDIGPICRTCLASRLYGKALSDILNNLDKIKLENDDIKMNETNYKDNFVKYIIRSSAFNVLRKVMEELKEKGKIKFILGLDDYNYRESSAIIALIMGDGDSFGYLKSRTKSLDEFYLLSIFFSEIMERGILKGICEILKLEDHIQTIRGKPIEEQEISLYLPLTPLYIAGDDFLLVIRGEHIPRFIKSFYKGAHEIYDRISKSLGKVLVRRFGISMGIVAGRTDLPGLFLYDASLQALKYTKDVTKRYYSEEERGKTKFSIQASLIYVKSSLSWNLVRKICGISSPKYFNQYYNTFLYIADGIESPIYNSLKVALSGEIIRAGDLREVMESFLPESEIPPCMAFIRWISDIARKIDEEKKAEAFRDIVKIFIKSHGNIMKESEKISKGCLIVNEDSWKWLYTLISLLDIIEDRGRGELGIDQTADFLQEIGGEIIGNA